MLNAQISVSPGLAAILDTAQQQPPVTEVALHAVRVSWLPGGEGFGVDHVRASGSQGVIVSLRRRRHEQYLVIIIML